MFIQLFFKECRQILKCTTYYVILICIILFYSTQLGEFTMIEKPKPGQEDYGHTYSKDETVIMNSTIKMLVTEYSRNSYVTYPIGFYKTVKLNKVKQLKMESIILEATGMTKEKLKSTSDILTKSTFVDSSVMTEEEIQSVVETSNSVVSQEREAITAAPDLSYERFLELMKQADKLLGGGSQYRKTHMNYNAYVPMTYEEALAEYNDIINKDHLSGAYARYFCDYLGIVLAILPVFLAVTRGVRDKRARASQVIFSRQASSLSIILSRYLSMVVMLFLPIVIISGSLMVQCMYSGASAGISIDYMAFFKYDLGWLLPSIMISTAVGLFLTELTESAIAIIFQGIWWFISLFMGVAKMMGGYGWNLMPRHNILGNYQVFHDNFNILAANRIAYAVAAIVLAAAAVIVYDLKRKGKLMIHGKIFSNRKSESEI